VPAKTPTAAKGAAVLNMLRNLVGEANFRKGLKAFLDKFSWQAVTSDDFRKVMEQVANQELRYFFIQWLESSGSPEFKLEYTVFRTPKGFRVVGKINTGSPRVPSAYRSRSITYR